MTDADGIVYCACGNRHWGHAGAAGVLAWRGAGDPDVILQLRAGWSMSGGTWGIPGGAIGYGESPIRGGLREAREEAGLGPARVWAATTLHHPDWSYTTAVAEASPGQEAVATDHESDAMEWVPWRNLGERVLMPAFEKSMPLLEALLGRSLLLIHPSHLPQNWEDSIPQLAAAGIPATALPEMFRRPIEAGMAASADGSHVRTAALFPDVAILGSGAPLRPASPAGAIPASVTWIDSVGEAIDGYSRILTLGVDLGPSHALDPRVFLDLVESED